MPDQETEEDTSLEEPRDRVFEFYEAKIPSKCEQCKYRRSRVLFLRRLWGEDTKLAFVCPECAAGFRKRGALAAAKITETLEANGGDVNVE